MAFNYKKIGSIISEVDVRNSKSSVENLIGVTIDKVFIPSVANTNGTDLSKYKIIHKNQFACSLMQVSRDGGVAISMYKSDTPSIMSPAYFIFEVNTPDVLPEYLELVLYNPEFDREATFNAVGGVRGTLTWEDFCNLEIHIPTVSEQEKIVNQYDAIVNRIDVLERLSDTYKRALKISYEQHVLNCIDFTTEPINKNIQFINGLAMQKFPATEQSSSLPVIKIRELNQGFCDDKSDYCTSSIKSTALINNGDMIFSWSATLLCKYWYANQAGLNQHLFKVESTTYPSWFVYLSILHHIDRFQKIAQDKGTTFGHITKDDLDKSEIIIPSSLDDLNVIFVPLLQAYQHCQKELYSLTKIKNALISRL